MRYGSLVLLGSWAALVFVCACSGDAGSPGPGDPGSKATRDIAADDCDAFSRDNVPVVSGTANPDEVVNGDGVLREMKLGPVVEPGNHTGSATLRIETAGRYAFIVFDDPPSPSHNIAFIRKLGDGPEALDYQACDRCACNAVDVAGSYELAAGDYHIVIMNMTYPIVRFVVAPVAAP